MVAIALPGILIAAALFLRALQRIFTGQTRGLSERIADVHVAELCSAGTLLALSLAIGVFPRRRQWWTGVVAATVLIAAVVAALVEAAGPNHAAFEGSFAVDTTTGVARILAAVGGLLTLAVAAGEVRGSPRESETYALLLFSCAGVLVMAGAADLLVLATGFLLTSIPLYGLIGLVRSAKAAEAAMKAYLMGALFGIVLFLGISVLYESPAPPATTNWPDASALHRLRPSRSAWWLSSPA